MLYSSVNKYASWQHIKKQRHHFANKGPSSQSYGFSSSHVPTMVLKKTLESPLDCMEIQSVNPKGNQPWILIGSTDAWCWSSNMLATWCEEHIHWKRPWCWERLRAGRKEGDRGWDGWMASLTQWKWVWANSGRYWRMGKPGMLQSTGLQESDMTEDWKTTNHAPPFPWHQSRSWVLCCCLFACFDYWLCWVFVVKHRFSLVAANGTALHCRVWASHCSHFFLLLQSTGSRADGP